MYPPKLRDLPVTELTQSNVRDALELIWHKKAASATKVGDRRKIVLDHAAALGFDFHWFAKA